MKMKKETIKTIALIVLLTLVLLVGMFMAYSYVYSQSYAIGYNQAAIDIVNDQTQTGNIYLAINDSIQKISFERLCGIQ